MSEIFTCLKEQALGDRDILAQGLLDESIELWASMLESSARKGTTLFMSFFGQCNPHTILLHCSVIKRDFDVSNSLFLGQTLDFCVCVCLRVCMCACMCDVPNSCGCDMTHSCVCDVTH